MDIPKSLADIPKSTENEAELAALRGFPIELLDGQRFFEALGIAQRNRFRKKNELLRNIEKVHYHVIGSRQITKPARP